MGDGRAIIFAKTKRSRSLCFELSSSDITSSCKHPCCQNGLDRPPGPPRKNASRSEAAQRSTSKTAKENNTANSEKGLRPIKASFKAPKMPNTTTRKMSSLTGSTKANQKKHRYPLEKLDEIHQNATSGASIQMSPLQKTRDTRALERLPNSLIELASTQPASAGRFPNRELHDNDSEADLPPLSDLLKDSKNITNSRSFPKPMTAGTATISKHECRSQGSLDVRSVPQSLSSAKSRNYKALNKNVKSIHALSAFRDNSHSNPQSVSSEGDNGILSMAKRSYTSTNQPPSSKRRRVDGL